MKSEKSEAEKFDAVVRTLLSVSHEEIQKLRDQRPVACFQYVGAEFRSNLSPITITCPNRRM